MKEFKHCIKCNELKLPDAKECPKCGVIYTKAEDKFQQKIDDDAKKEIEAKQKPSKIKFQYSIDSETITDEIIDIARTFISDGKSYIFGRCEKTNRLKTFNINLIVGDIKESVTNNEIKFSELLNIDPPFNWNVKGESKKDITQSTQKETGEDVEITKTCPFCAEEIQEKAIKCKHCNEFLLYKGKCTDCGAPLKTSSSFCSECGVIQIDEENVRNLNDNRPIEQKVLEASFDKTIQNKKSNTGVWIFIAVIILLSIAGKNFENSSNNAATNSDEQFAEAKIACKEAIKSAAPYGANPSAIFDAAAVRTGDNILVRFSDFEINNAFGAKRKSTAVCTYVPATKTVRILRINNEKVI